jgi:demethylmenaquinone methyltransferase/2-methoxy-6-polyprenyl-1,4-benzoquinol methylase
MATILRTWSYRYPWLYDRISELAALSVGGEARLRRLPFTDLAISPSWTVLDLCCGCGQATAYLVQQFDAVTGLDASPRSLDRARHRVPQAEYVQGFAEEMPLANGHFDLVHTSAALHEMDSDRLGQIVEEVYRVLKPGGYWVLVDLHPPTNPLFWPALSVFMVLFETETAWSFIYTDVAKLLTTKGFNLKQQRYYAGGSLQVIQAQK